MKDVKPHGARYPWGDWFRRAAGPRPVTLRRGREFAGMPHGMAVTVRQAARRMGLDVSVAVGDDSIAFRVVPREGPA